MQKIPSKMKVTHDAVFLSLIIVQIEAEYALCFNFVLMVFQLKLSSGDVTWSE